MRDYRRFVNRAVQRPEPQRLVAAPAVVAGDVGQSLNPESLETTSIIEDAEAQTADTNDEQPVSDA